MDLCVNLPAWLYAETARHRWLRIVCVPVPGARFVRPMGCVRSTRRGCRRPGCWHLMMGVVGRVEAVAKTVQARGHRVRRRRSQGSRVVRESGEASLQAPVVVAVIHQVVGYEADVVVSGGHSYVVVSSARHPGKDTPATGKAYEEK